MCQLPRGWVPEWMVFWGLFVFPVQADVGLLPSGGDSCAGPDEIELETWTWKCLKGNRVTLSWLFINNLVLKVKIIHLILLKSWNKIQLKKFLKKKKCIPRVKLKPPTRAWEGTCFLNLSRICTSKKLTRFSALRGNPRLKIEGLNNSAIPSWKAASRFHPGNPSGKKFRSGFGHVNVSIIYLTGGGAKTLTFGVMSPSGGIILPSRKRTPPGPNRTLLIFSSKFRRNLCTSMVRCATWRPVGLWRRDKFGAQKGEREKKVVLQLS